MKWVLLHEHKFFASQRKGFWSWESYTMELNVTKDYVIPNNQLACKSFWMLSSWSSNWWFWALALTLFWKGSFHCFKISPFLQSSCLPLLYNSLGNQRFIQVSVRKLLVYNHSVKDFRWKKVFIMTNFKACTSCAWKTGVWVGVHKSWLSVSVFPGYQNHQQLSFKGLSQGVPHIFWQETTTLSCIAQVSG